MAKKKKLRQRAAVGRLGKELTRRSRGKCELCASKDGARGWELPPFPDEPEMERTLMACERCRDWLEGGRVDPMQAYFLTEAIWSDLSPVKLAAARLILANDEIDDPWVRDALEAANVDPESGEYREAATE